MIFAVADIHGELEMLDAMLAELRARGMGNDDTLVFLGDYVDRGASSREVLDRLLSLRESQPGLVTLRGNHEDMMLRSRAEMESPGAADIPAADLQWSAIWLENGGVTTLQSYGVTDISGWWKRVPNEHWALLETTEMEYRAGPFHFVHAGLLAPGHRWEHGARGLDPRLWIREPFLSDDTADYEGRSVIFGHTPQPGGKPLVRVNRLGLDTGAVFGGPLSAAILDPDCEAGFPTCCEIVQIPPTGR